MATYATQKINSEKITVIPVKHPNKNMILGYDLIPMENANIFICATKGNGKTNVVFHLIKCCIDATTKVIVFSATHNSDKNWLYIKQWLKAKDINAMFHLNIVENGENNLEDLMRYFQKEDEEALKEKEEEEKNEKLGESELIQVVKFDMEKKSIKIKVKKPKKKAPKYLIIFDDMSGDLLNKDVAVLLKNLRHFGAKTIISSQYPNDLEKQARMNIDFWIIFRGFTKEKLEQIFPQFCLNNITFEDWYDLYLKVTEKPYQFLYIDKDHQVLRENFNKQIVI